MEESKDLIPFEGKPIRKVWHNDEWYFSVVDVVDVLTDSPTPRKYWNTLKAREPQLSSVCGQLKMMSTDGKQRLTDCANTKGILRIAMSVPSPKAEPLKLWLAEVGTERIEETENPEILTERQAELYKAKGYPDEWIINRVESINARKRLTDEWKARGVKDNQEYSILTATIAKGTFGLTPSEHGQFKGLDKQNLRDHMTPLELIFTALSEEVTRQLIIKHDAKGFQENHETATQGGSYANKAMKLLESDKGLTVVSSDNFLGLKGDKDKNALPSSDAIPPQ